MSARFQELDWRPTPLGELSLRRRYDPFFRTEVHEIKLDDEFLMSSLFTAAEVEMARLALAELDGTDLRVAVGGLGLGYTAHTVLESEAVGTLVVAEALAEVIDWHCQGLIPSGRDLVRDPRCRLAHGDFFAAVGAGSGPAPDLGPEPFHAVIVDIDHSPRHVLHPAHAGLYTAEGLRRLRDDLLLPGGVFALWSDDAPDEEFTGLLEEVFARARAEVVSFPNPLQERDSSNTVYIATAAQ
ncbi:spermidine synthase [Nocardiopsis algeriensis]|uniref:Spermidine synthase n=1 Tax=Nocardiopsis algeriensis TaxID=1478215 RepID=A0A841IWI7_9ACTN|nr:spermidine synthase [Nocardiopsis algeriensis]MBB6120551.1 spermidine synthase [Nocardiopsis algeriensis]